MSFRGLRAPALILLAGGLAMTLALGARHTFGLYLQPMTTDLGWARQTFAFAVALQNLIYGLAQPFAGMLADRFGAGRVMLGGTLGYVLGLVLMADTQTGPRLQLVGRRSDRDVGIRHQLSDRVRRSGAGVSP